MRAGSMLSILLVIFTLVGCATTATKGTSEYDLIPANGVSELNYDQNGNIIVKRDAGMFGMALGADFYINGKRKFTLSAGQYFQFLLPTGNYILMLSSGEIVNLGNPFQRSLRVTIADEKEKRYFRVFPMPAQGMVMEEIFE
jgi:hypothetical protein